MVAKKLEAESAKIVSFDELKGGKVVEPETETGGVNPGIDSETRWVSPIKDRKDVTRCIFYLRGKVDCAYRKDTKFAAWRNWMLFILGVNIGLRVCDLTNLKWKHIFEPDMKTFIDLRNKRESERCFSEFCNGECNTEVSGRNWGATTSRRFCILKCQNRAAT